MDFNELNFEVMKYKTTLILMVLMIYSLRILAQNDTIIKAKKDEPFQLSFIYPLGTGGVNSAYTNYSVSLNVLGGYNNGVNDFEAGAFLNMNQQYVNGAQFSGFLNVTGLRQSKSVQSNVLQFAGFGNINNTNVKGGQVAGFMNTSHEINGAQVGGFLNIAEKGNGCVQVGGFFNVASIGDSKTQIAGFGNYCPVVNGPQISGFVNVANECSKSLQMAGFVNGAVKADSSVQIAGFVNVAAKSNVNTQVAGFINVGRHVSGVQLAGFINICDSIDGVPIAPISIVRYGGYQQFELSVSDFSFLQASYKLGVKDLYMIYNISKLQGDGNRWAFGGGIGHEEDWQSKLSLNTELMVYQELFIGNNDAPKMLYVDRTNLLTQLKVAIGMPVGGWGQYFVAPTLNWGAATHKQNALGKNIEPLWGSPIVSRTAGRTDFSFWVGFSTGFRF